MVQSKVAAGQVVVSAARMLSTYGLNVGGYQFGRIVGKVSHEVEMDDGSMLHMVIEHVEPVDDGDDILTIKLIVN